MFHLWTANLDYLVLRSALASSSPLEPISIFSISDLVQYQLRLHGVPTVRRRRKGGGFLLKSTDLDLHILQQQGQIYVDFFIHPDALYLRPGAVWERVERVHALLREIPRILVGPLQVHRIHLTLTFSGGGIGHRSIRRIQHASKPWPEPVPYVRGECVLYSKTAELAGNTPNQLRKRYLLDLCAFLGYRPEVHGDLWRLEFRLKGDRIAELGFPDLPRMLMNFVNA